MAKKTQRPRRAAEPAAMQALSAKLRKTINNLRRTFSSYVDEFKIVLESREELAPKFMKAFAAWQVETEGGTLAGFVRLFDPSLPMQSRTTADAQGYRDHPAYQAAEYLRRLAGRMQQQGETARTETPVERAHRISNAPVSPTTAMARVLKVIMPFLQPSQEHDVFAALRTQLHWPERTVTRIEAETKNVEPLVILRAARGVHVLGNMRLTVPTVTETEGAARTGTEG